MNSWVRLSHLKKWTGGEWVGTSPAQDYPAASLSTDTRTLSLGEVFVALRGENFDANHFLNQAVEKGAVALISETLPPNGKTPCLLVKDSLAALVHIASALRSEFQGKVVGITGSAGKSSTKEMVATLLGPHTVKSPASFNNLLGVAKTLTLISDDTKNLVLEMGMNAHGEIAELCRNFRPLGGLITNIGDAHIGKLGGKDGIFRAKKELFEHLATVGENSLGVALNLDDELVVRAFNETVRGKGKVVTYSVTNPNADIAILEQKLDSATGYLTVKVKCQREEFSSKIPIFGKHHAQNIAASVAMATLFGVSANEINSRLAHIRPAYHRGEVTAFPEGRVLIDESYNSNPSALASALHTLNELDLTKRRILVLGEMRELGEFSQKLHRETGELVAKLSHETTAPFVFVGVGSEMATAIEEVKKRAPQVSCVSVTNVQEATAEIDRLFSANDILFVKGSRGIQLDLLVNHVQKRLKNPA